MNKLHFLCDGMGYRAEATSVEGFVQQIACSYLRHGYWFYVTGFIPDGKDRNAVDAKLISKYGISISESTRSRRKKAGIANLQYIRHEGFFVILCTKGAHKFFHDEEKLIRDIRRTPLRYAGYSISYRKGGRKRDGMPDSDFHAHVEMERNQFLELKAWFTERAIRVSAESLAHAFYELPIAPYAPIRRQLLKLLREVNHLRKQSGRKLLQSEVLPLRRKPVLPFGSERG